MRPPPDGPLARRITAKLEAHVREFLEGQPWMPFQHTLGISGYESVFDHPDEMFFALSIALPFLSEPLQRQTRALLSAQLGKSPPFGLDGFDRRTGRPRESYGVAEDLRVAGRGRATSAFGVYAFWAWCRFGNDAAAARQHWPEVKARMQLLVAAEYGFDPARQDYVNDEASKLNGDLAGLLGFARLARLNGDEETAARAGSVAGRLLELRVNLERLNPRILEPTRSSTKHLHNFKLARFCELVPEVGEAVRRWDGGAGAIRLQVFREERNGWFMTLGDRLIGGENYTNPAHLPHALFAGGAFIEQLPPETLAGFVDVPWCKGDFYFVEKCVWTLWAASGRYWAEPRSRNL